MKFWLFLQPSHLSPPPCVPWRADISLFHTNLQSVWVIGGHGTCLRPNPSTRRLPKLDMFFWIWCSRCLQWETQPTFWKDNLRDVSTVLLYGCENWIMMDANISTLESFQGEIEEGSCDFLNLIPPFLPAWQFNSSQLPHTFFRIFFAEFAPNVILSGIGSSLHFLPTVHAISLRCKNESV